MNPQVLLHVKVVPDPDKFGWDKAELLADIPDLVNCKQLKIQGLMTILPRGKINLTIFAIRSKW